MDGSSAAVHNTCSNNEEAHEEKCSPPKAKTDGAQSAQEKNTPVETEGRAEGGAEGDVPLEPPRKKKRGRPPKQKSPENDDSATEGTELPPALAAAYRAMENGNKEKNEARRDRKRGERMLQEAQLVIERAKKREEDADEAIRQACRGAVDHELSVPSEWNTMFKKLEAYKERYGHCLLASKQTARKEDDRDLVRWVDLQRNELRPASMESKGDILHHVRRAMLDQLGFVWNVSDACWQRRYHELLAYKAERGDCHVSSGEKDERYKSLAVWVSDQRKLYVAPGKGTKKRGKLTAERIKLLEDVGFEFIRLPVKWDRRYRELVAYRELHGNCLVPQRYDANPQLGIWVREQMKNYKKYEEGKPTTLTEERIRMLDEIGFVWQRGPRKVRKAARELAHAEVHEFVEQF